MMKDFIKIQVIERMRLLAISGSRIFHKNKIDADNLVKSKFLFNTQYIHAFSELEFMCAAQLKLLGHNVVMLICDGLPYSEREIVDFPTIKSYEACSNRTVRYCNAYGLEYIKINSFLNEEDKNTARELSLDVLENIRHFEKNNINLGEFAKRNHAHYFKGDIKPEGEFELIYRKAFESAYLIETSVSNVLSQYHDYNLVTANGKFIQSGIPVQLAKDLGRSYYTYEVFGQGNGVIVDKNQCSLEQRMEDVWDDLKSSILNQKQLSKLYHSFDLQQKSQSSAHDLWDENRIDDDQKIISMLGIDVNKKIIACYPNVYWDSVHMGIPSVAKDLTQWLVEMIEFADSNKDIQLVIRCHPAEVKVFDIIKSKYTMSDTLNEIVENIPSNVIIIEPSSDVSSYSLARIADANLLWNGTIGLELILRGIKPIVIADAYYSNKGFTADFLDFEELKNYLLNLKERLIISDEEKRLAEIFCFHVRFNRKFNAPYYLGTRSYFYNYSDVSPGRNKTIDNLVEFLLDKNSCMNIGSFDFE